MVGDHMGRPGAVRFTFSPLGYTLYYWNRFANFFSLLADDPRDLAFHRDHVSTQMAKRAMREADASASPRRLSQQTPRIAILCAGHLRNLCRDDDSFASLANAVALCRSVASCDLFLFTWSTLEPRTSPWTSTWRSSASEQTGQSSAACVERVRREIGTVAIRVDDQPQQGCFVNGSSVLGTWRTPHDGNDTQTSYGAIRCQVTAVQRADTLRREYVNARQQSHSAAVRLRPDLYDPMGAVHREYCNRMWRSRELGTTSGPCVWQPRILQPDNITWAEIAQARPDPTAIHGCGNRRDTDSAVNPGEKNGDHCMWSAPPSALEALVTSWVLGHGRRQRHPAQRLSEW